MKYSDIIEGLKNGEITITGNHRTNSLIEKLERQLNNWKKQETIYLNNITNNVPETRENQHKGMLSLYQGFLNSDVEFGSYLEGEQQCFDCGDTMYIVPLNEKEIAYVDSHRYWKLADDSGKKYDFIFTKEHFEDCACCELRKQKKLVSTIEVPTGELVFQNFFNTEVLYENPEKDYSINSILGRNELMQYLSSKNVGYGQMGNTSVIIYSNKKEIVVAHCWLDGCFLDNKNYYEKHPEEMDDNAKKSMKDGQDLLDYLEKGKFKKRGEISLSVWRWMCADKSVLEAHNEPEQDEYSDKVTVKVKKGTWCIEHYYDFPVNGDYLCSKLKLKN